MVHFLLTLCIMQKRSHCRCHKTDPSLPSFFSFFFFVLQHHYMSMERRMLFDVQGYSEKRAIVAEIAVSWSQLSANRLSVWNGEGRWLRQRELPGGLLCSRWSRGLTIIYHIRLHWQLSDEVTCFALCYVYCFSTSDLIWGNLRKNHSCKM